MVNLHVQREDMLRVSNLDERDMKNWISNDWAPMRQYT
jgi:hypothetical protein